MNFNISSRQIYRILKYLAIGLALTGLIGLLSNQFLGDFLLKPTFLRLTDLKEEVSIGTWYSSSILLISSFLLFLIARIEKKNNNSFTAHWQFLSIIFLFLSLDEAASIHEVGDGLHDILGVNTATTFLWTVPYTILLIFFIFGYYRFLVGLPKKTRRLFIISGGIFIAGALGLELLSAILTQFELANMVPFVVIVEEFFELFGVTLFIYALISHISSLVSGIHIFFGE